MTSTNEELPPPPKPRLSPLDFRNTDLVSRLLAATPPYLYNMPMVPNSYFFSEMLRSFVQAKADATNRGSSTSIHHRRPRKRSWTQARAEYYQKSSPKPEKRETSHLDWPPKAMTVEKPSILEGKQPDKPLELTMGKVSIAGNGLNENEPSQDTALLHDNNKTENKLELENHMQMMYPPINQNQETTSNLILPPPPPIWYPPLYPTPYGIDPLHFFIDLRVSGHIYDRKNQSPQTPGPPMLSQNRDQNIPESTQRTYTLDAIHDSFKQSRHASAFSVPIPTSNKNIPMNLSNTKMNQNGVFTDGKVENKECTKFDVISMGFDKTSNKTSTNYVMNNIGKIYNDIRGTLIKTEDDTAKNQAVDVGVKESEEQKEKRVKDLRALIGLELVVDYMNHAKPGQQQQNSEESSTDIESSGSPAVEVVAVQDVDQDI